MTQTHNKTLKNKRSRYYSVKRNSRKIPHKSTKPPTPPPGVLCATVLIPLLAYICTVSLFSQTKPLETFVCDMSVLFSDLSFSSINCNSLNLSSTTKPVQTKKIYAITRLKSEIILLSDIRLSSNSKTGAIANLSTDFAINPHSSYRLISHSTKNKRGVGILIKNNIGISDISAYRDNSENILAVLLTDITGKRFIVASVYGPNEYDPDFFANLNTGIRTLGTYPTILGGDWNATYSTEPININIDCDNMTNLPNTRHSNLIHELCRSFNLSDPYRFLWPTKKDFSYVTRNTTRKNKSRLDFFLISNGLQNLTQKCYIEPCPPNKSFDHKAVTLSFKKPPRKCTRSPMINHLTLSDPVSMLIAKISAIETYAHHLVNPNYINLADTTGNARRLIREAGPPPHQLPDEEVTQETVNGYNTRKTQVENILNNISLHDLETQPLQCNPDIFMEILLNNIRNDIVSYQAFLNINSNKLKKSLRTQIDNLKASDENDLTALPDLELRLNRIIEQELESDLRKYNIYQNIHNEKMTPVFLKLAKIGNLTHTLDEIRDNDNNPFPDKISQNRYIHDYFKNIYKKKH